jgi:predicted choloylglycine hydrolase
MKTIRIIIPLIVIVTINVTLFAAERQLVAKHGKGYLEKVNGYPVLHLKGSYEQMGTQHGILMKKNIHANVKFLLAKGLDETVEFMNIKVSRTEIAKFLLGVFKDKIPQDYLEEMKALARAADLPEWEVIGVNLIPELFHCSGFALLEQAASTNKLYHGRVLDYAVDWKLQENTVLIIAEPDGKIPFVNVSYAGFIGSVTGMNLKQISIGEMGGKGVGYWNGIPMSFLVRMVLEKANSLDQALSVFTENPRTCEYYYVIADAEINSAAGLWCTPEKVDIIQPGQPHQLLPEPVENTVLLSAGKRYKNLARIVKNNYGKFDDNSAIRLMDKPVAMNSNLHNALMIPEDAIIYVANADPNGAPAWKQKYHRFNIKKLISNRP